MCDDFGPRMVLCAGCRVGVCCGDEDGESGCLDWSYVLRDENFIYYCRFCNVKGKWSSHHVRSGPDTDRVALTYLVQVDVLNEQGPQEKGNVMFQYDPAIVVVSLNWHKKRSNIGEDIHRELMTKYVDHEERVGSPFHLHKDYVTLNLSICNRLFWSSSRWTGRAGNTIQSSTAARCTRWRASLPRIPRLRCSSS